MCVKEFYGYNCGHCSVPILRQCPLSASNPHYPVCEIPAERPVYTNDFCHPCSRVVWNIKVLKDEEEHRARHMQGQCICEVIFEGEDREKRLYTQNSKGKNKGKEREYIHGERHEGMRIIDHGAFEHKRADSELGCYDYRDEGKGSEEYEGIEDDMQMAKLDDDSARSHWEPAAQTAAYEYVGYYAENDQTLPQPQSTDPEQSYVMALGEQGGQLSMGETGSGMRWYPQQQQYYQVPQLSFIPTFNNPNGNAPRSPQATSPRAASRLNETYDNSGSVGHDITLSQPVVVSSDMTRSKST